ncbi:MAG: TonB-dependent receptor [Ignavibacteria bacterium]|nr:MAG: TonB-dependent receptor [Ignavibacteria bacterium]
MSKMYKLTILLSVILFSMTLYAQKTYKLSGVVTSAETGEKLVGANVFLKGTTLGAATDIDGKYSIDAPKGTYTVVCSYVGFERKEVDVNLTNNMKLDFSLKDYQFSLNVTVVADRAKERETPVAFTNVDKKEMEYRLGSRDIPMALNTTPSVYATQQGGGAGDARINVRGFNQRNIAIMINGVPVNDMENGWVYWSNWDGLGDATSSIQIQRGLSAVNLATPSIGGTMNIITDPTQNKFGVKFKQEFGSGSFLKSTLSANTGLINGKWAVNATIVRKIGDGVVDKTWTDAWAYYFGAAYNVNDNNRIEMYLTGAPQRHGQNLYKQNIAAYSHDLAKELGYSQAALDKFPEATSGRLYNENWGPVSSSYKGKVAYNDNLWFGSKTGLHDRYATDFINERENFFHKPILNMNWYSQLSKSASLYTTLYWSGGTGGGTGTYGSMKWNYHAPAGTFAPSPSRFVWWDGTIAANQANLDSDGKAESKGILRNSRNDQWTYGLISKAYWKLSKNFKTSFGVDWRTAEIDHYREVRDLLGGDYYVSNADDFHPNAKVGLGDKIVYYNTNTVDWFGAYAQGEYSKDRLTAYGTVGWSMIKYSFTDHFSKDASGNELFTESDNINGYQFKGGASFRLNPNFDVFANAGYVSKVPIFDQVINDFDGTKAKDPKNEKFTNFELGVNYTGLNGKLNVKGNFYYTTWLDRAQTKQVQNLDGSTDLIFLSGVDALHMGFELEAAYAPVRMVRFDGAVSLGNWKYLDDVTGTYKDYSSGSGVQTEYTYYIKDLKVGDQPQTSVVGMVTLFPIKGMSLSGIVKYYADHYANFDPLSRTDATDRAQSWLAPSYTLVDFHFAYDLPFNIKGINLQLFGHVFNALDELYIQDATDNSRYNAFKDNGKTHSADDAEVFVGLPRTFNVGISLSY